MGNIRREIWGGMAFLLLLLAGLLAVLGRCSQLQIYRSDDFRQRAQRQQRMVIPQTSPRGLIVDREGRVLALSVKVPSVWVDPLLVKDKKQTAEKLGDILTLNPMKLHEKILARKRKRFMWIKRYVGKEEAEKVRALKIRGVMIQWEYQRQYPMGELAAHVLGFTDIDGRGREGIECQYDKYLEGKPGRLIVMADVSRRPMGPGGVGEASEPGKTVVLSLDAVIQACVEEQLKKVVKKYRAQGASCIVMDPVKGEVLALANLPTFNPTEARRASSAVRRNRVLTDPFEPGSTFKPFTLAAALQGNFVGINQKINCLNHPYSGKGIGTIHEYRNYHGVISVAEIIERSSNIGSAKLAQKMGKKYFHGMIDNFGFGKKTGIDLPGEGKGIFVPLENDEWRWGQYALTRASYGQGPVAVTPMQLIRGFCCLVNGGILVKPQVARGVIDRNGEIVRDYINGSISLGEEETAVGTDGAGHVISEKVSRQLVEEALVRVIEGQRGTARAVAIKGYRVFGKTGTAKVPRKNGRGYEDNKYVSSFIGGAPVENPKLCVLVQVRQPDRSLGLGYTGGRVAGPVAREILRQGLAYLGVARQEQDQEDL